MKHTQGKWNIGPHGDCIAEGDYVIAERPHGNVGNWEQNAHLIASATELLKALKAIRNQAMEHPMFNLEAFEKRDWYSLCDVGGDECDWTGIAITAADAIAKAEGRTE